MWSFKGMLASSARHSCVCTRTGSATKPSKAFLRLEACAWTTCGLPDVEAWLCDAQCTAGRFEVCSMGMPRRQKLKKSGGP